MQHTGTKHVMSAQAGVSHERWRVFGFAVLMLLSGGGLGVLGGVPRLPDGAPRLEQLIAVLSGSTLPPQPLALVLVDLAWLLWAWIVGSLGLQVLVQVMEALAQGAVWARSLRRLADRVTFPLARRAVAAALAVQILSRGVPLAAAQPLTADETAMIAEVDSRAHSLEVAAASGTASEAGTASYVVRAGDTLWSIAGQAYGSGTAYRRLVDANVGRRMPDGHVFTAQGVIRPGWELVVPEPQVSIDPVDGQRWYTVGAGDTLSGVAAEILGDGTQWSALFTLNRGAASLDGKHSLTNPDVIWPGLRLRLPPEVVAPVDASEPAPSEPAPLDLVAAGTTASAPPAPSVEASIAGLDDQSRLLPSEEIDPMPLLRTLHVVEPIAAEPPTDPEPGAGSTLPDDVLAPPDQKLGVPTPFPRDAALGPAALGGLGLVALAGVAIGTRRMRRLRSLPQVPETEVVVEGGFAEARLAQDFTRGLHGVGFDPIAALVDQLRRFLDENELSHIKLVALRHGRSATTLTLAGRLAEQPILVDLAPAFAARLGAGAEAWISADQDVVYRLVRMRKTRLLPAAEAVADSPCLVPLGVLYDRQEYVATCTSLGHVLIASLPGHGADTILTSLVATLTARRSPQQLRVWMIARPRALPAPMFDLPHLSRSIDPGHEAALMLAAEDLRAEVDRRALQDPGADLVVVVPELTSLGEQAASFELMASRGASLGVRFIAATSDLEEAARMPLASHFGTRMVLRMQDEEASVALLGVADAAFLGGGGRLLLRLDGREPVELYGYQVSPEHLERLVRVMRSAYPPDPGWPPNAAPPTAPTPFDGEASVEAPRSQPAVAEPLPPTPAPVIEAPAATTNATNAGSATNRASAAAPVDVPAPLANHADAADGSSSVTPAAAQGAPANHPRALDPASAPTTAGLPTAPTNHASATNPPAAAARVDVPAPPANQANAVDRAGTVAAVMPAGAPLSPNDTATPSADDDAVANAGGAAADANVVRAEAVAVAAGPPLQVMCFGGARVLCAGQQVWPRRRSGEAKPWEFLLYLACQPADGVSSEDAVEALWPEDEDAADPAHRFRQLRYRLRHQLATVAGGPTTDGICLERGTLRLDPQVIYSDAQEFLGLVRRARSSPGVGAIPHLERARELYQGDLLEGPDTRRYAWVDERDDSGVTLREHFRRLFEQGSARLAEMYAVSGDLEAAVDLYRELTDIDPADERLWRALFRLHADRRDRLALVREEHRLRAALRNLSAELDDPDSTQIEDPSRETQQEYHRLLDSLRERDRAAV